MSDEQSSVVPGASESSALKGIQPVEVRPSDEVTVPIPVETMEEAVEHSKDSVALERGIQPIEP